MSMIDIVPKTETLQAFQLTDPPAMLTALEYISALPGASYSGSITAQNAGGAMTWQLLLNNQTHNASAFAALNDWVIVENGSVISVCPAELFDARYQEDKPGPPV